MNKELKAFFLSLLVFPGLGHLFVKKYTIALGFILSASFCLWQTLINLYAISQEIIKDTISNNQQIDVYTLSQALINSHEFKASNISTLIYLFLFIWLFASFDAYRLARQMSKKDK